MSESTILYDVSSARVATITLNRPAKLNAISAEMADALGAALDRAASDEAVGCIAIVGAGKGFCAGGDLDMMAKRDDATGLSIEELDAQFAARAAMHARIPLRLHELDKPTVAILNGAAAGAGLSLALACDIRVASAAAKLTTGFARVGRSGDFGGTFFLSRLVGPSRSRELYFTSEVILADQACRMGLVDHVYPPEDVLRAGLELAQRIAAGPPHALARMKQAFRVAEQGDLRRLLEVEARFQTLSGLSAEGQEFLSRFRSAKQT
jgi:2-(1,2-epoxy-1,2-dihydrophenyl)acetyl-CoA isomerase